jgi:hypothetical protein
LLLRGEKAVIVFESLFEGRAFSHGTHAKSWLIVKIVDAAAENSNDKVYISCEKFMSSIIDN